jgi:hypothetical protein
MRNIDAAESIASPELKVIQTGGGTNPGAQFTLFAAQRAAAGDADAKAPAKRTARAAGAKK